MEGLSATTFLRVVECALAKKTFVDVVVLASGACLVEKKLVTDDTTVAEVFDVIHSKIPGSCRVALFLDNAAKSLLEYSTNTKLGIQKTATLYANILSCEYERWKCQQTLQLDGVRSAAFSFD